MGRGGSLPRDEGTVEVLGGWRADPGPAAAEDRGHPVAGAVVAAVVAAALVVGSWPSGGGEDGAAGVERAGTAAPSDRVGEAATPPATAPPARLEQPIGHRLVVLTLTGLLLLDPDTGSHDDLELGSIRSFGAAPAVATLGPSVVAVLFADGSVGAVHLDDRSIRRIAQSVQAVLPATEPGTVWIRRHRRDGHWELTRIDAEGRSVEVSVHPPGALPPRVVAGRPTVAKASDPRPLGPADAPHLVELHERPGSYHAFAVRVEDRATGRERWLRELSNPPVLTPDGRFLLTGERITNRLTAYELATGASSTLQAPDSAGVTLDWENVAVLAPDA